MKKLNLFKVFILLTAVITSFGVSAQSYQRTANIVNETSAPYYAIFNLNETLDLCDNNLDVTLVYPCNKIDYQVKCNGASILNKIKIDVSTDGGKNYTKQTEHGDIKNTSWSSFNTQIATNINNVAFLKTGGTSIDMNIKQIKFTIVPHILLNTSTDNNLGNVEIGGEKKFDVDFKSFLTSGNLTVSTDNNNFLINGKDTKITLCGGNVLEKLNENTKNFQIVYKAKAVGPQQTANITIKDEGTGETKVIKISATCVLKTPKIEWMANKQIAIEESILLTKVAKSTCGTPITFTSDSPDIIEIKDGKLIAKTTLGKVNITATTTGNNEYKSITETVEFEVTEKEIQNINWNQDFYLLKVGDEDITLNAKAVYKKTGAENGNPIEYTVAEGGESVVTITDGILHIVGKGQTLITASQVGSETHAAVYLTKSVIVREVSEGCSGKYALVVTEAKEEGCDVLCGFSTQSFEVKHHLATRGDKLSFITDCTDASVSRKVKVTDQSGNVIYDGGFGEVKDIKLAKTVTDLTFFVQANFRIRLSNIFVTQATYLETETKEINFAGSEIGKTGVADVTFNWENHPDMMWATIEGDTNNVFSVDQDTYIFGGACGEKGTSTVEVLFAPIKGGSYTANLVIYRGEGANMMRMTSIPINAVAIKTPQFITWEQDLTALNPVQGGVYELDAVASSELPVYYLSSNENVARIENNKLVVVGAGEVTITAKQDGNINFEAATELSKTITIAKLDQTITWNQEFAADMTIGNTVDLTATASSKEAIVYTSSNEAVATIAGNVLTILGVGEATITATQAGNNNYNPATEVAKSLTIAKLNQTITWNQDLSTLQIGASETLDAVASSALEVTYSSSNEAVASINGSTIVINGEGTVVVTAIQAGNDTYNAVSVEKTFTFGRTMQTITWNDDLSALEIKDTIMLTATSDANLAVVYTIDNSAVATIEGNMLIIVGAGVANITASQPGNETYNSASVTKSISIVHLTQTIEWAQDITGLTLGSEPIVLTATATSGLDVVYTSSNTAVALIKEGNMLEIVGAGEAVITARQVGNNQYIATELAQTLNIAKLDQIITWEQDLSNVTLVDNFIELTATTTSGLPIVYTTSNDAVAQIQGNILSVIGEGEAVITATCLGNENYNDAVAVEKTLSITKKEQEIIWLPILTHVYLFSDYVELNAYSTSGLEVTYESSNNEIAVVEDNLLFPLSVGIVTITAYQTGDDTYKAATPIAYTVNVTAEEMPTGVEEVEQSELIYAAGVAYFGEGSSLLRVFDITGNLVY